ncbi:MAG: 3-hydroxyacyl-CoA dehydrogenase NAD-binding domain-containing protein [Christensenella sp.]|uniref:3-hydroxyacyl-CoA dehydrogenase family protein n=1 Tax=Christensenella sp. TaxID=1935934 RepID=UPI002B216007|nr:3-hydroxyacyl-CoA dehydrogenase NAD-binding domain-containing protein [Christensenella sp.]MEA5002334.1 3-hydroxyacyl-CoA dehydrogenase NAD-binding domain-containing protein [Christensenella sp.]
MKKMSVIGAGTMGAGIAQVFAQTGWQVVLADHSLSLAKKGLGKIKSDMTRLVQKEKLSQDAMEQTIGVITVTDRLEQCDGSTLVVEAVYEDLRVKQDLFCTLEKIVQADTILASNTSSISITQIAAALTEKGRFAGMHFFNPAGVMNLVEVIAGMQTSADTTASIIAIAKEINKTPVPVDEGPGFVVNRLLIPMINEAIGIYAEGIASAQSIDTAMKLGANHPIGPLSLGDLIGLDICLAIMEVLHDEFRDHKYSAHPLLRKMVRAGMLGKKTGQGFFTYQ